MVAAKIYAASIRLLPPQAVVGVANNIIEVSRIIFIIEFATSGQTVVTLYLNGEMGRDSGGIWFRSPTPVVFQTQPVNTLDELNSVILRHMGVIGGVTSVRRVAYRLLNLFPPNQFKYKIFWVEGDQHVRGMFELHRKYGPGQIMELLAETQTVSSEAGGSSSSAIGGTDVIPCSPIHVATSEAAMQLERNCEEDSDEDFVGDDGDTSESSDGSEFVPESQCRRDFILPAPAPIPDLSSVSSHFHTLYLDDMI
ncbi:hypothetical protein PIB30_059512 [Stylosanthes scabra]|uniref:Uncharacterized protein n=1 Tax=Stylosanthes scabra TaxID=79078 RepID=A0ABU6ZIZ9_9FABA|nr:hypothetical protein [Stylosanthes scabra]